MIRSNRGRFVLSYHLRTLFVVVTVIAGVAGWVMHQVQQRSRMRSRIEASGGVFREMQGGGFILIRDGDPSRQVSALRKLLGDKDEETIVFPHQPNIAEMDAAAFFPEAEVLSNIPDFLSSEADSTAESPGTAR